MNREDLVRFVERYATFPTIITLCGSTKYPEEFMRVMMEETLKGNLVISVGMFGHSDIPPGAKEATADGDESTEVKQMLDRLHLRKIDLADKIIVINPGGYIGSSTRREIEYASGLGKEIEYLHGP
jgi:hypothetical protein